MATVGSSFRHHSPPVDKYSSLPTNEDDETSNCQARYREPQWLGRNPLIFGYCLLFMWTVALIWASWSSLLLSCEPSENPLELYSPLKEVVEYERTVFNQGIFEQRTIYMGTPSEAQTEAWKELTNHGVIKMNSWQASQLYNRTVAVLDEPDSYIAAVEMWHQLHCLNYIRTHIWAENPTVFWNRDKKGIFEVDHMDHCIDYLRQTIMCHGDIGIITFRYGSNSTGYHPNFNITHTCRSYEPLREWVDAHRAANVDPDAKGE